MDSVEISRLFQWECNMRAKRFYSVGLFLHNCCHLYLYGALIVFGCSEAVRNAVLMTSSSVTIISASRWSGSATARRTARWAKTKETAKEQVKKTKQFQENQLSQASEDVQEQKISSFSASLWRLLKEKASFLVEVIHPAGQQASDHLSNTPSEELRLLRCCTDPQSSEKRANPPADWLLLPFQFSPRVLSTSTCAPAEAACQPACDVTDMTTASTARMRSAPASPPPLPPPPLAPFIKTLFSTPTVASYPLEHQRTFPQWWNGWKVLTSVASCPGRSAAWKSAGRTSSSVWTERTASRGVGAATTSSTAWTTATRKTAARVGSGVHALRQRDSVTTQMVW